MHRYARFELLFAAAFLCAQGVASAEGPARITVLYDNTAHRQECSADWGFSCLIEGMEKTILFDTGTKGDILLQNAVTLAVDISRTGLVVISHLHMDHTGGLPTVLPKMRGVPVWLPDSAPAELREHVQQAGGMVTTAKSPREICKDVWLTGELGDQIKEQALILETAKGLVVVTGCSHPGIVKILETAKKLRERDVRAVIGGFHLLQHSEDAVARVLDAFRGLGIAEVGATHCTGAKQITQIRAAYAPRFIEMGVGRVLSFE